MTIRSTWCEDCDEDCHAHARVCTTCGGALTIRPDPDRPARASMSSNTAAAAPSFRAMPDLDAFLPGGLSTSDLLQTVRQQVQATTAMAEGIFDNDNNAMNENDWQAIPAAILDPQNSVDHSGKRPTSKEVLKKLPRETLSTKSPSFFDVAIQVTFPNNTDGPLTLEGVTSELGPLPSISPSTDNGDRIQVPQLPLWIPERRSQRTAKESFTPHIPPTCGEGGFLVVLERGDGISFFSKTYQAQQAGAQAVIVMNDKTEPWPYVMKDSLSAARSSEERIQIPTVMISLKDGQRLLQQYAKFIGAKKFTTNDEVIETSFPLATVTISSKTSQKNSSDCVICTDQLALGQTVLTLTNYCGHAFHEKCALKWLQSHNTCPYCRRTLPTDNSQDEADRRRQMTASSASGTEGNGAGFYS